jgi:hypothetical protein
MGGLNPLLAGRTIPHGRRDCLERQPSGGQVYNVSISVGLYWDVARAAGRRLSPKLARRYVDVRFPAVI